ncbi:MAG: hypothetical protein IH850_02730 [Acidobacteria bacterium]|nr:hypothetical protein [Acidobacteriota bacterium]
MARILAGMTMTVLSAAVELWTFAEPQTSFAAAVEDTMASLDDVLTR